MILRKGFTLVELMVAILIVGILATVSVPIVRGRIDTAKWVEAKASAGAVKTAVRAYIATSDSVQAGYSDIEGSLGTTSVASTLGFTDEALNGTYFYQSDYVISDVDGTLGRCVVTVTSTHPKGPSGTGVLDADGSWSVSTEGGGSSGDSSSTIEDSGGSDTGGSSDDGGSSDRGSFSRRSSSRGR